MERIAQEVGLKKPSLYHYVAGKDEILYFIHEEFIDLLLRRQYSRQRRHISPEIALSTALQDVIELMETHRGHVRVFFEHHRELPPERLLAIEAKRSQYFHEIEKLLRNGMETGAFARMDVRLTTLGFFGICNWAYKWYSSDGPLRFQEVAYHLWQFAWRGLEPRPEGAGRLDDDSQRDDETVIAEEERTGA